MENVQFVHAPVEEQNHSLADVGLNVTVEAHMESTSANTSASSSLYTDEELIHIALDMRSSRFYSKRKASALPKKLPTSYHACVALSVLVTYAFVSMA